MHVRELVIALVGLSLVACGGSSASTSSSGSTSGTTSGTSGTSGAHGTTSAGSTSGASSGSGSTSTTGSSGTSGSGSTTSSSGSGSSGSTGGLPDGGFQVGPHAALPQVLDLGGPVLSQPKVQPIFYPSDPGTTDMVAFLQELATTTTWATQTGEYGVGALSVNPSITISGTAPQTIDDSALQQMLVNNLSGASPAWGAADASTIYLFFMPAGTTVTAGGSSCSDFDGYHDELAVGSVHVAYAVVSACPGIDGPSVTDVQQRTVAADHELVEAATDPLPESSPAYGQEDDADVVWTVELGGEVADMCEFNGDAYFTPPGSTYMIQRTWSNAQATALHNPCVPLSTTDPYFNATPVLPDTVRVGGTSVTTSTVKIPVGQSKTIDLQLFSEAATSGPFDVSVYDMNSLFGGNAMLDLTLDRSSGGNGDTLHLTITPSSFDQTYGGAGFVIFTDLNGQENVSMGWVSP